MARPQDKTALISQTETNYQQLGELISQFSPAAQESPFLFENRDKNIRDVLVHLHEWQQMMAEWYRVGMSGAKPTMPKAGYTWRTTAELNQVIWQAYQETSLAEAQQLLAQSHQEMLQLIEQHTNEELFTKKYYPWTGTSSLGSYLVSSTSSHYDWALKKIRKQLKLTKKNS